MRVLILGDGIALTTGFAQVLRACAAEFVARGWNVEQIAGLDIGPKYDTEAYRRRGVEPYFATPSDYSGRQALPAALKAKPDVIFINSDPGTAANWFRELERNSAQHIPTVLYAPIEGAPVHPQYAAAFKVATRAVTYTEWSSRVLAEEHDLHVPFVYHGVDTDVFRPAPNEGMRRELRRRLGWENRFVVLYVARNAGRKAQDRLIKALAELHAHGERDVLLALHCTPFDNNQLQGWDLDGVAHWCGVSEHVQFSEQRDAANGIDRVSLADKYRAADLYVHAAKVEGFGLPILEAMASGLPVIVPADGGNMEEVVGPAALAKVAPYDWETWFNGAQLVNLSPVDLALAIKAVKDQSALRKQAAARSVQRAAQFSWSEMARTLADVVESVSTREPVPA